MVLTCRVTAVAGKRPFQEIVFTKKWFDDGFSMENFWINSKELKQHTSFGLSSSQHAANISDIWHCNGESKNDLSHAGCQEILASSLDDDIFDNLDDYDWLYQIPDEALLLDEKAFVEKGDNGVISKALLLPRENVPVPRREDVIPKSNSQSITNAIVTSHDSAMLDQENKNIPSVKERETIPLQLIRRSILSDINDNKQGESKKSAERPPLVDKPNALEEGTNTMLRKYKNLQYKITKKGTNILVSTQTERILLHEFISETKEKNRTIYACIFH
uniref:Uncharacterized protein n=1 Tax=Tetranychus urticae TaxID=32264 RepID=T1KQW6_TETUR